MGKPIKISDELYERLKVRAEEEGGTLQDALFSIVEERNDELARFREELDALRKKLSPTVDAIGQVSSRLDKIASSVETIHAATRSLSDLRRQDVETFNSWIEVWKGIEPLEELSAGLKHRLQKVERLSHQHFWQDVGGE
jgi:CII-binding regulator of phage lambda lysogenization HflD